MKPQDTPVGPKPWGGWGFLVGGLAIWSFLVLQSHVSDLGIKEPFRILGDQYSFAQYRGIGSVGELAAVWGRHVWHLILAVAIAAAALGWGLSAMALLRLSYPSRGLRELLSLGAGFSLLGLAMLGGGLVGLWYAGWPAAWIVLGATRLWKERGSLRALVPPPAGSWGVKAIAAMALAAAGLILAVGLAPEAFYDSLVYHLADPFNWAKIHKVTFLPYNFFSNFPFTFEMLFSIGVLFGHDSIARLTHVAVSFTAAGLVGWMAAWIGGGAGAGWIAAAIYLTTPLIASSAWMTGIDAGLVLYEMAAVLGVVLWWTQRQDHVKRLRGEPHWLLLAAVFGGLGMGVKYTLGLTVGLLALGIALRVAAPDSRQALRTWLWIILALLLPWTISNIKEIREAAGLAAWAKPALVLYAAAGLAGLGWLIRRWGFKPSWRGVWRAAVFGAVVWVFVSPWNAKSWLLTHNPVYPFAFNVIESFHISPPRMTYQMGEFREYEWRPLKEWLFYPWHLTKIAGFSNNSACGGLFLAMLPLLLVFRGVDLRIKLLGITVLGRYLIWSNLSNIIRYFAPGLALLGVLIGVYLNHLCAQRKMARGAGLLAVGAFSSVNLFGLLLIAQTTMGFLGVVLGLEKERDFFLRERPSYPCPPYAACEAMNRGLPGKAGVLYVGEARGSFYQGRLVAATVFDFPVLLSVCAESANPADVNRRLKQFGLSHVFFNGIEARRTVGYRQLDQPTDRTQELFERWWGDHLQLTWKAGWLEVYEIVPAGVRERTAALKLVHAPEYQALTSLDRKAMVALQRRRLEEAEASARALVLRAPRVARAHEALAEVLSYRGQNQEALEEFRKAQALGLVSSQVHYNMSLLLRRLGRESEAAREYQKSVEVRTRYSRLGK